MLPPTLKSERFDRTMRTVRTPVETSKGSVNKYEAQKFRVGFVCNESNDPIRLDHGASIYFAHRVVFFDHGRTKTARLKSAVLKIEDGTDGRVEMLVFKDGSKVALSDVAGDQAAHIWAGPTLEERLRMLGVDVDEQMEEDDIFQDPECSLAELISTSPKIAGMPPLYRWRPRCGNCGDHLDKRILHDKNDRLFCSAVCKDMQAEQIGPSWTMRF